MIIGNPVFTATDWAKFHPEFSSEDDYWLLDRCDTESVERNGGRHRALVGISGIRCFGQSEPMPSREEALREAVKDLRRSIEIQMHFESPESLAESRQTWAEVFRDKRPAGEHA